MAPAKVRRAPYKDFLQPALQRRFSSTASCLFLLSYIIAILLGDFHSRRSSCLMYHLHVR